MAYKISFTKWNAKIALLRASVVFTYYIKLFLTGADKHNCILMSLLILDHVYMRHEVNSNRLAISLWDKVSLRCGVEEVKWEVKLTLVQT